MAGKNKKLKILLIEDSGMFLTIMSELLVGHQIIVAKTAKEGWGNYKKFKPDMIFLDLALPDGHGNDLLLKIKENDKNAYIIMLTASRLKEDIMQSMQAGAQGYVIKPFSSQMINQCIKEYFEYRKTMEDQ